MGRTAPLRPTSRRAPSACPLGVPFLFSSELFEGTCLIRLRGTDDDNPEGKAAYFAGRKRTFQGVAQGRFKASQAIRGDAPENEPDVALRDIVEDCFVLGGSFKTIVRDGR